MNRQVLTAILSCALSLADANGQTKGSPPRSLCSEVSMFDEHPITSLPVSVHRRIREALHIDILAIVHDPGMGIDTKWPDVKLDAIQILQYPTGGGLYAVHWGHPQFGVNGFVWIVELEKNRARNIGPASKTAGSFSGWGMQVLPASDDGYPELMFASKGYHEGGGAEAEAVCARKTGSTYNFAACPVGCFDQLNAR
jgi:hypothetical protein